MGHTNIIKQNDIDSNKSSMQTIRPEVKEAIDNYEDYIDSYCDFMKSYDSSNWTMLSKYSEFMSQYFETTGEFDEIADLDLNEAESSYYSEVEIRCSEKMLKAAYDMQ